MPIIDSYDAILLDLDGVVYLGTTPIDSAVKTIKELQKRKINISVITNNGSVTSKSVSKWMKNFDLDIKTSSIVTSSQTLCWYLQQNYQKNDVGGKPKKLIHQTVNVDQIDSIVDDSVFWQNLPLINQRKIEDNDLISEAKILHILTNLIGQKDLVSGEILKSGEKIYVCLNCKLGYHEDSWYYLNQRCEQCKANINQIKSYILPEILSDSLPKIEDNNEVIEQIKYSFRTIIE